jgi:hypothetical protein
MLTHHLLSHFSRSLRETLALCWVLLTMASAAQAQIHRDLPLGDTSPCPSIHCVVGCGDCHLFAEESSFRKETVK